MSTPADTRTRSARVELAMRLSVVEGMCYALMVGLGEAYFLADAVRLGASALQAGLVVSLPLFAGAAGPLIALRALLKAIPRRRLVFTAVVAQATVLLALMASHLSGHASPNLIIAAACLYQVCGQAAGTGWASWFGDLVPAGIRGRYFERRNRGVHLASFAGLLCAGLLLQWIEPESAADAAGAGGIGFCVVFSLAAGFRLASAALIACTHEPRFQGLSDRVRVFRFLRTERGSAAWRLIAFGAVLQLVVYTASPYFAPFMLNELRFSYVEYMLATICVVAVKVASLPVWGRLIDQHGARPLFGLAVLLLTLIPLPFMLAHGLGWVLVGQMISGFSWGGHEVSHFSLLLESSYKRMRPQLFAAQSLVNGSAQLLGSLLAAALLLAPGLDLRHLFALSLVGRLVMGLTWSRWLPAPVGAPRVHRIDLLLRVLGIRAHGGLVYRPLDAAPSGRESPPEEERESGAR